jgi:hypothetical protein
MALHDYEQRKLEEIERHLAAENPRLARHLAELAPVPTTALVCGVLGSLILLFTGLVIMVVGVRLGAPPLIVIGAALTAMVPAAVCWYIRRRWM